MNYVDGFVVAVPVANKQKYIDHARKSLPLFKEYGAVRIVECWGDDISEGETTDFKKAVKARKGEVVLFSWIEWPDKATRDSGVARMMEDPLMAEMGKAMPFDGKRMIFGGFQAIVDTLEEPGVKHE